MPFDPDNPDQYESDSFHLDFAEDDASVDTDEDSSDQELTALTDRPVPEDSFYLSHGVELDEIDTGNTADDQVVGFDTDDIPFL